MAYVWLFSFSAFACRFLAVDSSLFRGARRVGLDPPQPAAPGEKDSAVLCDLGVSQNDDLSINR